MARGFMPRKPVDRRRAERDSNGLPSGNIDLKQRKDWSIWADKMVSSRGIYTIIKEKRTALSRKRIPLNQNECTADFRIGVPFEQNLQPKN